MWHNRIKLNQNSKSCSTTPSQYGRIGYDKKSSFMLYQVFQSETEATNIYEVTFNNLFL